MFDSKALIVDLSSGVLVVFDQVVPSTERSAWLPAARAGMYAVLESGPDHGDLLRVTAGDLEPSEDRYVVARHRVGLLVTSGRIRLGGLTETEPASLAVSCGRYAVEIVELDPTAAFAASGIHDPDATRGHQDFCPDFVLRFQPLGPEEPLPYLSAVPRFAMTAPSTMRAGLPAARRPLPSPPGH